MKLLTRLSYAIILLLASSLYALAAGFKAVTNETSFRWGPYRPNLYFGIRPLVPRTLLLGLMWANGENEDAMLRTLRDTCEENDGVASFSWTMYDTRTGGIQIARDAENHVEIKTEFLKDSNGESWGLRVTGTPMPDAPGIVKTAVIFHIAAEEAGRQASFNYQGNEVKCQTSDSVESGRNLVAVCDGTAPVLGRYRIRAFGSPKNKVVQATSVKSSLVHEDHIWQAKSVFSAHVKHGSGDKNKPGKGNVHFLQTVFEGAFTIDFIYSSNYGAQSLNPSDIRAKMARFRTGYPRRIDKAFPRDAMFRGNKYPAFTQALISNLLGGMGYFYGDSIVDDSHSAEHDETQTKFWEKAASAINHTNVQTTDPTSLLSFTPSRAFFPRGFLWDEGFHLLPVIEWDLDLSITVLSSWLSQIDSAGWIAREQILGAEARSKVPQQFHTQYQHHANPPTLVLLIPHILAKLTTPSSYHGHPSTYLNSTEAATDVLERLYPLLARHYNYFRQSQAGNMSTIYPRPTRAIVGEAYRWRGRTPDHTLPSGLDDYPRANPPHPGELHVDALAWVGAAAQALQELALHLGKKLDASVYRQQAEAVRHNLDALHWDERERAYCDGTIGRNGEYERVCHLGYVSLMPLLLGLMNGTHPHLPAVLDLLFDRRQLWSAHGVRSLSLSDGKYGTDEDYWRGAVWVNLNVLAVLRLWELGREDGPERARARSLARELREKIVKTVYDSWVKTGFVWEQYDDVTGEGRRSRGFTGWTACVLLLLGLEEDGKGPGDRPWKAGREKLPWLSPRVLMLSVLLMVVATLLRRRLLMMWRRTVDGITKRR